MPRVIWTKDLWLSMGLRGVATMAAWTPQSSPSWMEPGSRPSCRPRSDASWPGSPTWRSTARGITVVRPGEPCPALGLIADGRIALRLAVPGRESRTIQTLEAGDIFGWSAVLEGSRATSLAVTLQPTRALLLDRVRLAAAMEGDCELASAVYRLVLGAVARRLQATRLQLLDLYRAEGEPW